MGPTLSGLEPPLFSATGDFFGSTTKLGYLRLPGTQTLPQREVAMVRGHGKVDCWRAQLLCLYLCVCDVMCDGGADGESGGSPVPA